MSDTKAERNARTQRLKAVEAKNAQDAADINDRIALGERYVLKTALGTFNVKRASISLVTGPMIHTDGNGGFGQSFCAFPSDCTRVSE